MASAGLPPVLERIAGRERRAGPLTALFALTLFLSATLVFFVQPMFAKMALPLLGGSPGVWNTCVVFFQAALLAGYAYAHLLATRLGLRRQAAVHAALLAGVLLALPVAIPAGWIPPAETMPIPWLLLLLVTTVGAPFFAVSTSAPLLQTWFARTAEPGARDPYFLYAASNAGSLLALLAYPFVVEPTWTVLEQSRIWAVGYALLAALIVACALATARAGHTTAADPAIGDRPAAPQSGGSARIAWAQRARWIALAAVPSSLMLAVTSYLSTDIAAVPLLWTVPLSLYLLSFVFAFSRTQGRTVAIARRAMPLLVSVLALFMVARAGGPLWLVIPAHLLAFLACAITLHALLAQHRPATRHLTEFYLWVAAGGVAGGVFNTILAPWLFTGIVEYPLALVLAAALQPPWRGHVAPFARGDVARPALVGAAALAIGVALTAASQDAAIAMLLFSPLAVWCFSMSRRPLRFGLAIAMWLLAGQTYRPQAQAGEVLTAERTFFGVHRVLRDAARGRHTLFHGNIIHGQQSLDPARRTEPLTYYHRAGPVGDLFTELSPRLSGAHIGVVGLGAGAMAAYARPGQRWTFYEIDPAVERIAREPRFFTYLEACGSTCGVELGDARLTLARTASTRLDVLVLDAFSSDAIPVHLLSREAIDLYLSRLAFDGVLAFHISNRHVDLRPVLAAVAAEKSLVALTRADQGGDEQSGHLASVWMVMARSPATLGRIGTEGRWTRTEGWSGTRVWTDSYSDLLGALTPIR